MIPNRITNNSRITNLKTQIVEHDCIQVAVAKCCKCHDFAPEGVQGEPEKHQWQGIFKVIDCQSWREKHYELLRVK